MADRLTDKEWLEALEGFVRAAHTFNDVWDRDKGCGAEKYPFQVRFDEMVIFMDDWLETQKARLNKPPARTPRQWTTKHIVVWTSSESWECPRCGNTASGPGFYPVLEDGKTALDDAGADYDYNDSLMYRCDGCGLLIQNMDRPKRHERYRLRREVDRYPHALVKAGAMGTITESDGTCGIHLKLDIRVAGLEEWDNCLIWSDMQEQDFAEDTIRLPDSAQTLLKKA